MKTFAPFGRSVEVCGLLAIPPGFLNNGILENILI